MPDAPIKKISAGGVICHDDKTDLPQIRIQDAWLLRQEASNHLHELWAKDRPLTTDERMREIVASYNTAWQPFEHKILHGMCDILDLSFRQNIIDVYIAPWFSAFSSPMVIGVRIEPDKFVDVLTHELLHRLLTDNTTVPYDSQLVGPWRKLFGDEHSWKTLVHIPVHAVHKAIYLDILQAPERLERDIATSKQREAIPYIKAWEYVNSRDYKEIIEELKHMYTALGQAAA